VKGEKGKKTAAEALASGASGGLHDSVCHVSRIGQFIGNSNQDRVSNGMLAAFGDHAQRRIQPMQQQEPLLILRMTEITVPLALL
jgi:hypothetical protein